jgi:hypothetical protein
MYTTTRKTSAIFASVVIAATVLILLTSTTTAFTPSVFAAKVGLSHHSSKDSNGNTSSGIHKSGDSSSDSTTSTNTDSSTSNNTPSASNGNENLKNLFACESAAANGSGKLTKTEVINCYSQTFSDNPVSSGHNDNSAGDIGSSGGSGVDTGSTSTHHASSSSSHTHHHHNSAKPNSLTDSTTSSNGGS